MSRKKNIKVGVWSYDNSTEIYKYSKELKKILYNMSAKGKRIVLVSPLSGEAYEMILGISKLLGLRYDIWMTSKPRQFTKEFSNMEHAIFNRILYGARGYKIIPHHMESVAISNHLDVLILLKDNKIYISNISPKADKTTE